MRKKTTAQSKVMARARRASGAAYAQRRAEKASDLAARNAYREACGLPLIDASKDLLTKAHDRD